MRGSYLAKLVESDMKREQRLKSTYAKKKYIREKCSSCKNKTTDLCHIVEAIDGKLRCVNYEQEE